MTEIPWLLVAFAGGTVFGGAVTIALLSMILLELPFTIDRGRKNKEWKYD